MELLQLFIICGVTLFASVVETITGFGLSTFVVPVLLFFFPYRVALLFAALLHLSGGFWRVVLFKKGIVIPYRLIVLYTLAGASGAFVGSSLSIVLPEAFLVRMLGGVLVLYCLFFILHPDFNISQRARSIVLGGLTSGFSAGLIGVRGALDAALLSAFNLDKNVFIFVTGVISFFVDITRISMYFFGGASLPAGLWYALPVALVVAFLGALIGRRIVARIDQKHFRSVVIGFLFFLALYLLIFSRH
jgi:uncharacterized membrane protein YfcA